MVVDLPLVPVMPTTLCGGSARARLREQFDIADHRHAETVGMRLDRMRVERHAGTDHHARIAGEVRFQRIGDAQRPAKARASARSSHTSTSAPARQQRFDRRPAGPRQSENGVFSCPSRRVK